MLMILLCALGRQAAAEHLAWHLCRSRNTATVNTVICLQSPSEHSNRLVVANAPGDFVADMGFEISLWLGNLRSEENLECQKKAGKMGLDDLRFS